MAELFELYFDFVSRNSPYNSHLDVDLSLRLKSVLSRYSSGDLSDNGKLTGIYNFLNQYNAQIKSATNDAVDASAVQRLIADRDNYAIPFVHSSFPNTSAASLLSRIESAAKNLGLEAFQDQSSQGEVTVHTVTIAGTILVIDMDLTSSAGNNFALTRLKTSYATNSNTALEPIDRLLVSDLDEFVTQKSIASSPESTALRCERAFQRFERNLQQLVLLDKLSQKLGNQLDLFVSYEVLVKAFEELCTLENASIPQPKYLHLYPSLDINGHGLALNHSIRPYLTQVLHVSTRRLLDPAQAGEPQAQKDMRTLHIELREHGWPFSQPFPSKVQPTFTTQAPANLDIQVLPTSEKAVTAYAVLNKDVYLPRSACMAIQAALGYSDNMRDDHKIDISWLDCIFQHELQRPAQPVTQTFNDSRSHLYTLTCAGEQQSMVKVSAVPFRTFAELLRIIEIIKAHLFFEELLASCLNECELSSSSEDKLNVTLTVANEPLSIQVEVDGQTFQIAYEQKTLAVRSSTMDDSLKDSALKAIVRTRSIPVTVHYLTSKLRSPA